MRQPACFLQSALFHPDRNHQGGLFRAVWLGDFIQPPGSSLPVCLGCLAHCQRQQDGTPPVAICL